MPPRNMWLRLPDDVVELIAGRMHGQMLLFTHPRFVALAERCVARELSIQRDRSKVFVLLCAAAHVPWK